MSAKKIDRALEIAAVVALGSDFTGKIATEAKPFTPVVGAKWAQLTNLRSGDDPATLGVGGQDEASGAYQIDVNVPETANTARADLLGYVDAIKAYIVTGRTFTHESQCVHVRKADVSQIRRVDGWLRISVSVFYLSRSTRGSY